MIQEVGFPWLIISIPAWIITKIHNKLKRDNAVGFEYFPKFKWIYDV